MKRFFGVLFVLSPFWAIGQARIDVDAVVGRFQQFFNKSQYDSVYTMLSPRSQTLMPQDKISTAMGQLHKQVGDLKSFKQIKQEEKLTYYKAEFEIANLTLIASVNSDNKLDAFRFNPYKEETSETAEKSNFVLNSVTGKIFGTLTMPENATKVPVVLLIAGSGPTDRNGNNGPKLRTNAYKMMADSFLKAGIACVRFDKRGIGESAAALTDPSSLSFDTYVDDAIGFIKMLKNDTRFSDVIVAGHSEGSLIGMMAAKKEGVKKYISIAGAGERIDKTIRDQYAAQSKPMADTALKIMDSLRMGKEVKHVPDALFAVFNPGMQPYMRSWLKYDPQAEIKKLQQPVLIIQGDNDLQVSMKNSNNLKKAIPKAKLVVIKKMNHALKDAPTDREQNFATYEKPELPLSAGFMSAIVSFIKG